MFRDRLWIVLPDCHAGFLLVLSITSLEFDDHRYLRGALVHSCVLWVHTPNNATPHTVLSILEWWIRVSVRRYEVYLTPIEIGIRLGGGPTRFSKPSLGTTTIYSNESNEFFRCRCTCPKSPPSFSFSAYSHPRLYTPKSQTRL